MKNWKLLLSSVAILTALAACSDKKEAAAPAASQVAAPTTTAAPVNIPDGPDGDLLRQAMAIFKPLPTVQENVASRKITDAQIALGHKLFFDPRLSQNRNQSCNTCHILLDAGADGHDLSPSSVEGQKATRNTPTVLNSPLQFSFFWDGRAKNFESQAEGPILSPNEMAMPSKEAVEERIRAIPAYVEEFAKAFPDGQTNFNNIVTALAAFEQTLLTPSPWDKYLQGDINALTPQQRTGLKKFIDHSCVTCHSGVNIGGTVFKAFGSKQTPYWELTGSKNHDLGRYEITKNENDKMVFRAASLRNVTATAPYFHDGSVAKLEDAIRIMGKAQLNIVLSDQDVQDIAAFLASTRGTLADSAKVPPRLPN